ncbi:MAG: hypothetical protein N2114_05205, partial [Candidatus Goldbacteria bacterium]|nr:hypothetical protein [Candidatus Goldiibacteriota bacterium]
HEVDKNSIMMFCLIIGVSFGYFVGQMDIWNRKLNTLIMHSFEPRILQGNIIYLFLIQLLSFFAKYIRDVICYLALFILGIPLAIKIFATLPEQILFGLKLAFWIVPILGFAVIYCLFQSKDGSFFHGIILFIFYIIFAFDKTNIHYFIILTSLISFLLIYNLIWKERSQKN